LKHIYGLDATNRSLLLAGFCPFFLADSSAGNAAQIAEAKPSSPQDPSMVAARAKVAATVAMAATKGKKKGTTAEGEDDRRRPARGRGRRAPRR
jgi:hypothetical protein